MHAIWRLCERAERSLGSLVLATCDEIFARVSSQVSPMRFKRVSLRRIFLLTISFLHLGAGMASAHGPATNGAAETLRPFYIIGHGANTLAVAKRCLQLGANGIECDVNLKAGETNKLYIGHGPWMEIGPAGRNAVPLKDFLHGLHELARQNTNFCLVYFDCKTLAATPEFGRELRDDIRQYLTGQGDDYLPLNALISVGTLKDKAIFADIANDLGPREGIMVDGYSRPGEVAAFFDTTKAANRCFSDGTVPFNTCLAHFEIDWALHKACKMRARDHKFCFVGTWTVNNPMLMKRFIRVGVDGILADRKFVWYNFSFETMGHSLRSLSKLVQKDGPKLGVRAATRADNPFLAHRP